MAQQDSTTFIDQLERLTFSHNWRSGGKGAKIGPFALT